MYPILLHPFSIKIIQKDYAHQIKDGVLYLNKNDDIVKYIFTSKKKEVYDTSVFDIKNKITEEIKVVFPRQIDDVDKKWVYYHLGYLIYKHHISLCMNYIIIHAALNGNVLQGIRNFMEVYDVDENDIATDTLYKNYQRKGKKDTFFQKNTNSILLKKSIKKINSIKEAHFYCNKVVQDNYFYFISNKNKWIKNKYRALFCYICCNYSSISVDDIAKEYDLKASNVYYFDRQMRKKNNIDHKLSNSILLHLGQTRAIV
jgi:hypothetical protein